MKAGLQRDVLVGTAAGLVASFPQVAVTQALAKALPMRDSHADIGPRFVERAAGKLDHDASPREHWLLAGVFHFAYSAGWGALYGLVQRMRRTPPYVLAPVFAGAIYLLAFSRFGAATQMGSEPHPDRRSLLRGVLHWAPALTFSFVTAYTYEWLQASASTRSS